MIEAQDGSMQRQSGRAAVVRQGLAVHGTIVNPFAAQRRSAFSQVNAHLVGAAGFQATFDQHKVAQVFHDADVRYGALPGTGSGSTATSAIASILNQTGLDPPFPDPTADDCQVTALDGVSAKLFSQVALGRRRPAENHQAASIAVQPVYGTDAAGWMPPLFQ
jgi:hypothetical protein